MAQVVLTQMWFDGAKLRRPGEVVEIDGSIPVDLGHVLDDAQPQNHAPVQRPARRRSKSQPPPQAAAD